MDHITLMKIIMKIRPGEQFALRGDTLADLEWLDTTPKPTQDEVDAGKLELDALNYRVQRAAEYPPIGDGLDALVHKENGDSSIWTAYVAACEAVKAKYPKPS